MILQCPACNARYAVPDHAIGAEGRKVRCVKCAHEWFVEAPKAASMEALEALLKEPEKPVAKPIAKKSNLPAAASKPSWVLMGALAASLLLAIIGGLLAFKPGWVGYSPTHDITITDLKLAKQQVENGTEYAISGKLANIAKTSQRVPIIRIALVDKQGAPLQYWQPLTPDLVNAETSLPFTFGPLKTSFTTGDRLVVEMGNSLELALRRKPQ